MSPSCVVKPRFPWVENPRASEIKTLGLVLSPKISALGVTSGSGPSSEALRYRPMGRGDASAAASTKDARLFGPIPVWGSERPEGMPARPPGERPVLQIETSVDLILGETALVRAEAALKSPASVKIAALWRRIPNPIPWMKDHKTASAFLAGGIAGTSFLVTFFYFHPILTLWIAGIEFAALAAMVISYIAIKGARDLTRGLIGAVLNRLMRVSHHLLSRRDQLALPPGSGEGEGPFRSQGYNPELLRIRKLGLQVLAPTPEAKYSDRVSEIRLLGDGLKNLAPQQPEFRLGIEALEKNLGRSPVIRYSSRYWEEGRRKVKLAALESLGAILDHNPELARQRDPHLISVSEMALRALGKPEILDQIYRASSFSRGEALIKTENLLQQFSKFLGEDHPQVTLCKAEIRQYYSSFD